MLKTGLREKGYSVKRNNTEYERFCFQRFAICDNQERVNQETRNAGKQNATEQSRKLNDVISFPDEASAHLERCKKHEEKLIALANGLEHASDIWEAINASIDLFNFLRTTGLYFDTQNEKNEFYRLIENWGDKLDAAKLLKGWSKPANRIVQMPPQQDV